MKKEYQCCPLCNCQVDYSNVYPHYICNSCVHEATGLNGEPVIFFHTIFFSKGLQGYYRRNNQLIPFEGNSCYIKDVKCFASYEAGVGVVVQPVLEDLEEQGMVISGNHTLETSYV